MRYSIIIPVYNAEKTIARCLESLLQQGYDNAEIVIVNDGSKDNSGQICRKYEEEYSNIRYYEKENGGVSSARNMGIERAKGDYICFVDSDDYVLDNYFNVLDKYLDFDLVVFSYKNETMTATNFYSYPQALLKSKSTQDCIEYLISKRNGAPWNKRFKRSIIEQKNIRFPVELSIGEDFIFGLEYMLMTTKCIMLDNVLYCVDTRSEISLTRKYKKDVWKQSLLIYDYAYRALEQSDLEKEFVDKLAQIIDYNYCRTTFSCVEELFRAKEKKSLRWIGKNVKNIVGVFKENKKKWYPSKNIVHFALQCIVMFKWSALICVVAFIHKRMS